MDFETFEKIYNSRAIIHKMLTLRGYDSKKFENETKEELNILFQNHSKKLNYDMDSLDMMIEGENNKILVKYILNDKLKRNLEKAIEHIYTEVLSDEDTCVIITKENHIKNKDGNKNSSSLEEYINRNFMSKGRLIQILCLTNYCFDISEHELTPTYRILSEEEKQEVLDKYHITEEQNPNVFVSDPLATFYGVKVGNLVEVTKTSETNGYTKYYRLCKFS